MNKKEKEKKRKNRFTIRKKLILAFTGILLIPSILIGTVIFVTSAESLIGEVTNNSKETVKLINQLVDEKISDKMLNVEFLGRNITPETLTGDGKQELIGELDEYLGLNTDVDNVFVATKQGSLIQTTDGKMADTPAEILKSSWFSDPMQTADTTFISPVFVTKEKTPVVYISRQLKDGTESWA